MEYTMKNGIKYQINPARDNQWDDAMELAFKVFLKFEAKEYGKEGTDKFVQFLTSTEMQKMFRQGLYILFVATVGEDIIGLISLRSGNHISLLFVDENYHRQGIGRALIKTLQDYLLKETSFVKMTVHASPYGIPFYERVGFEATDVERKQEGIIYTPMEMYL